MEHLPYLISFQEGSERADGGGRNRFPAVSVVAYLSILPRAYQDEAAKG